MASSEVVVFLIASVVALASFTYIVIMGPSRYHRNGIVGRAYVMLKEIPVFFFGLGCAVCCCTAPRKGRQRFRRCCRHTFHERNWVMVGFYIVLVWPVEFCYLFLTLPRLKASLASKAMSWALVLLSEWCYGMAVFVDPGTVTTAEQRAQKASGRTATTTATRSRPSSRTSAARRSANISNTSGSGGGGVEHRWLQRPRLSLEEERVLNHRYLVDGLLYALSKEAIDAARRRTNQSASSANTTTTTTTSSSTRSATSSNPQAVIDRMTEGGDLRNMSFGVECRTCRVSRPSRSKHCSLCDRCVRRYDHHCPWINNDVAENTQRYFLGFLLLHALSCTWACVDLFRLIRQFLIAARVWGWRVRLANQRVYDISLFEYALICVNHFTMASCLLFFAVCIGIVLYGFWAYQMYYAVHNLTMNDMNKIDEVVAYVQECDTLEQVRAEAIRVRNRLEAVAERKPRRLYELDREPAPLLNTRGYEEGGKKNRAYRAKVAAMVEADMRGIFDRGWFHNLCEVFMPYAYLRSEAKAASRDVV